MYICIYIYLWVSNSWYLAVHARIAGIRCSSLLQMMVSEVSRPTKFFVGEDPMWSLMVLTRCQQRLKPHSPTALITVGFSWVDSHRQVTSQCADPFFWFSPDKMLAGCCTNGKVTTFPPGRSIILFLKILWRSYGRPTNTSVYIRGTWSFSINPPGSLANYVWNEWQGRVTVRNCRIQWFGVSKDKGFLFQQINVWCHHSILVHSNFIISIIPGS